MEMLAVFFGTVCLPCIQFAITFLAFRFKRFCIVDGFLFCFGPIFFWFSSVFIFECAEIGDTDLSRKISLCEELLEIAAILEPGQSIFRGKLLVELQEALAVQLNRRLDNGEISKVVARVSCYSECVFFYECIHHSRWSH